LQLTRLFTGSARTPTSPHRYVSRHMRERPSPGSDPWKTGWTSFKFAKMLYVMPFLFAYTPEILIKNWDMVPPQPYPLMDVAFSFFSATAGTLAFSALTMAYLVRRTTILEWIFFAAATFLCFTPHPGHRFDRYRSWSRHLWWWQKRKNRLEQLKQPQPAGVMIIKDEKC
jgi:TRAP-type uncharacterized transport system fused permease subunit